MDVSRVASAIQSGLTGYNRAEQGVEDAALAINRLNGAEDAQRAADNEANPIETPRPESRPSLEAEAVNLIVNEHLAKTNIKVIKTADDMLGSLIDTKV